MKSICKILAILICVLTTIFSFGCDRGYFSYEFYAFNNTPVTVVTKDKKLSEEATRKITQKLTDLESRYSVTKEGSLIHTLNNCVAGEKIPVTSDDEQIFNDIKSYAKLTDNRFNPAVYPLVKLWQFSPMVNESSFVIPSESDISKILSDGRLNIDNFTLSGGYIYKTDDNAKIDLGGALKGYATSEIDKILSADGVTKRFISFGGSSITTTNISDFIAIQHPRKAKGQGIIEVSLDSKTTSISTSGDYEKFYTVNGEKIAHIINGKTGNSYTYGEGKTNILSATVLGENAGYLDALSTALCLCEYYPTESSCELVDFIKKIAPEGENIKVFVIFNDGVNKQIITNSTSDSFTILDSDYTPIYLA